jgi:glycosyltransferase involved in cell wall biosynthesis
MSAAALRRATGSRQRGRRTRVLLVHNKLTRFVRVDRDLLRARYDVEDFVVAGRWASPWRLWRAVRRCDVLFCWFASMHSLLPALAGRVLGRPVVMVVGGYDTANLPQIAYGHQRGGLKKYVARAAMALATRLIANSWYTAVEAAREAGMPAEKITVVYHGIALPMNGHRDGRDVARQTDLVLTVGNVDRPNLQRKGLEPFVQAAALLPHLRFVLVGEWLDGAIDDLRAIAPPNVTFTGRLCDAELHDLFGRAAVYVQASAHEGFGMALAEAMAAGCAPVVTRAGALPEVVGDAGVYAASADPAALATAIEHALAAGAPLGEAARARTAQSFTLDRRARGLAAVVDAAGGRRQAAGLGQASVMSRQP